MPAATILALMLGMAPRVASSSVAAAALDSADDSVLVKEETSDILSLLKTDASFIFLDAMVHAAGLDRPLAANGPLTVFAPVNSAFDTYSLDGLLSGVANLQRLRMILGYHVVKGSYPPGSLKAGMLLETLDGAELQVKVRGGQPWQLVGTYVGPPSANPADVSRSVKVAGYQSGARYNASNGLVYTVGGVLLPPNTTAPPRNPPTGGFFSGCSPKSCLFSSLTVPPPHTSPCCIQVDAAPRMPPGIFNDSVALAEYVRITQMVSYSAGRGRLVQAPCPGPNYRSNGTLQIDWFAGFRPWCHARCGCGGLFPCKDVPDDPATHKFCSLCGPKYNAPVDLQIMKVVNSPGWPGCVGNHSA